MIVKPAFLPGLERASLTSGSAMEGMEADLLWPPSTRRCRAGDLTLVCLRLGFDFWVGVRRILLRMPCLSSPRLGTLSGERKCVCSQSAAHEEVVMGVMDTSDAVPVGRDV